MNESLSFTDREFWRLRIVDAIQCGQIHKCIYATDRGTWDRIQKESSGIIRQFIKSGETILDVGCGMGYLTECIPSGVEYTGIDISPDLIALGYIFYPKHRFEIGDARNLPYGNKQFDWTIARSLTGSLSGVSSEAVEQCLNEMKRVSRKTLLLNLQLTRTFELIEHNETDP